MRSRWTTTAIGALLAVALAACGSTGDGDDAVATGSTTGEPTGDEVTSDEVPAEATDDADDDGTAEADTAGAGFGAVTGGEVVLSGAIEQSWSHEGDGYSFIAAGGCQGDQFGAQIQVNDEAPQTVAQVLVGLDEDLSGGTTGSWETDDVRLVLIDWTDGMQQTSYDGEGTVEVSVHDAPAELGERRMALQVTATGLEGDEGSVDLDASVDWIMGCP